MKKTILFSILMAIGLSVLAQDAEYAITVPAGTSTFILPPRRAKITADRGWLATNAVTQGQIIYNAANREYYMVLVAGTNGTTAPTGSAGQVEGNGSVTLIHCQRSGARKAIVTQEANAEVWYHTGASTTTNGGEYSYLRAQQYSTDSDQAISVYSTEGVKLNVIDK